MLPKLPDDVQWSVEMLSDRAGYFLQQYCLEEDVNLLYGLPGEIIVHTESRLSWLPWHWKLRRLRCAWFGHGWKVIHSSIDHPRPHWAVQCPRCEVEVVRVNQENPDD